MTRATVPSNANKDPRNEKYYLSLSDYSVGRVLLELGKIENFINEKIKNYKRKENDTTIFKDDEIPEVGNSVLLQILMSPNDLTLKMLTCDDLGVSIFIINFSQRIRLRSFDFKIYITESLLYDI